MNKDLYDLSNALQAFVGFGNNLKTAALYGYKVAADQNTPGSIEMLSKLESLHYKQQEDILAMAKIGRDYINTLIAEIESQIKFQRQKNG